MGLGDILGGFWGRSVGHFADIVSGDWGMSWGRFQEGSLTPRHTCVHSKQKSIEHEIIEHYCRLSDTLRSRK